MNQTLLVLALLLLDLGFQSARACPTFYGIFSVLTIGDQRALNTSLLGVGATEEEKAAFGKIQECYNEAGVAAKFLDFIVMSTITTSPECTLFYFNSLVDNGVES
ncbi:secretoglobin family 2B member 2-like [Dipodomys spectabilis]|uniref:secretoglobin family 2B member 2-like n=1 Tax=Dipodomys spectabilis TaxID=105255 RepID=UPI001C542D30|nr:secretoglobin family 2B member 2-like [Dipodomys spectabilis]